MSFGCHFSQVSFILARICRIKKRVRMAKPPLKKLIQNQAYAIVLWQLGVSCLLALFALFLGGRTIGFSVLMGSMAYCLPNLLFVWRVFRYSSAHEMAKFMAAFFMGEMLKLILSAILFLVIVKYLPVSLLSVLVGFIVAILAFWIVCLWRFSSKTVPQQTILGA